MKTYYSLGAAAAALLAAVGLSFSTPTGAGGASASSSPSASAQSSATTNSITAGTFGLPTKYTKGSGDTWYNTWADDGNIYATSNDTSGFNGTCNSDITVNELTGSDPTSLSAPYVNCMSSYGYAGDVINDGCDWKSGGIISVAGTLYLTVARQTGPNCTSAPNGEQPSRDASIVKSTDHGRTWSNGFGTANDPNGAAPPWNAASGHYDAMFPGQTFTPFFINYGQDDSPASTAGGGDQYVYAVSNDGFAYDGNYLILGRVLRSEIGNLNASDWQFYSGTPGGNGLDSANWSSNVSDATKILQAPRKLSQPAIQYDAPLHRYILTSFYYYPFSSSWPGNGTAHSSMFSFYEAPAPWGPWKLFYSQPTTMSVCYMNCQPTNRWPLGLYDPTLVSKFIRMDGLSNVVFTSGDFTDASRYGDAQLYALHSFPFSLTSNTAHVTDDASPAIQYNGSWTGNTFNSVGSDYFDNGSQHDTSTPGSSVSFTFTGSTIEWIGSTNNNHGYADVSIDGGTPVSVDTYSPDWVKQVTLFKRTDLSPGEHSVTITLTNKQDPAEAPGPIYMDVDAFVTAGPAQGASGATLGLPPGAGLPPTSGGGSG